MVFNISFFFSGAMKEVDSDMLGLWFITLKVDVNYSSKPVYQINDNVPVVIPPMGKKQNQSPENNPLISHKGLNYLLKMNFVWGRDRGCKEGPVFTRNPAIESLNATFNKTKGPPGSMEATLAMASLGRFNPDGPHFERP